MTPTPTPLQTRRTTTTTERDPLIKAFVKTLEEAFVKTLEEATTNTSNLTSTQFECRRIMMDSLDIEPGTAICVGGWEAMPVVGNGSHNELVRVGFDGRTYTHKEFARSTHDVVRVVHYGII